MNREEIQGNKPDEIRANYMAIALIAFLLGMLVWKTFT